ncbi:MAG: DNA/RNA nuclease SfsA [Deltaproteobacteria bacterium]|nr:DNA/RNA nuclease SfsA [Deltaproteobacteria bacterium]
MRYTFPTPLVAGNLVRRYKRFLAEVALPDGRQVTAHCPNSGSMRSCLETGAAVRLSPATTPGRRTPYTWEMIAINGGWVGVNTLAPNFLAAEAARQRALPPFAAAGEVRREVTVEPGSRLDLRVELPQGPLFVEVKNVTLVEEGRARFPDAVTTRGAKHLGVLARLAAQGAGALALYVVQRGDAHSFAPAADIDPAYARAFDQVRGQGVEVLVVEALVTPESISLTRLLPVVC